MSRREITATVVACIALAGCSAPTSPKVAGASPSVTGDIASSTDQPIAKGIVKNGLYVNKVGVPLCPVTGTPIAKGKEVGKATYHGVEYHFCCAGCPDQFQADPKKYAIK